MAYSDSVDKLSEAFREFGAAVSAGNESLRRIGNLFTRLKTDFENSLTFSEMKRYLQLHDEHPELGFLDIEAIIRP